MDTEPSINIEITEKQSNLVGKLRKRLAQNKPADVIVLDMDGTVYGLQKNKNNEWEKTGQPHNAETSKIFRENNLPYGIVSARPDWDEKADREMNDLGMDTLPDFVISGAGTLLYWRDTQGKLQLDPDFIHKLHEHQISLGNKPQQNYNPQAIFEFLDQIDLSGQFAGQGFTKHKIDTNNGLGFNVVSVDKMQLSKFKELILELKKQLKGIKIEFSEDLKRLDSTGETFSGWVQLVPSIAGKDDALRYTLEKINQDLGAKPRAHIFGDASVDVWMLAMGASSKDEYECQQYALNNLTPLARTKLEPVIQVLSSKKAVELKERGYPQANLQILPKPSSAGILDITMEIA
ncbi:hypothetical protein A2313_02730 [Candidatus Roizmanbacteria bacterium RIFOXYB2_FULL_41_10]|uniref:Uncharacterized protein n=1 Tax=Candidatus Roizmanbacteria bacterium RIFOXYA1_FULL_41_12 TaxID=1802082 RepID=A0A1F7KAV2_9BACT|nr:MAG: hypothetical protein A2209_04890 [Candidatus Roizmanbacteria bacterium RIFOXYA1_FULL_41_12]OGK66741.1 MAG: hypothetical protein A2377_02430 [Candidatus Roizmanbacteria bacterium RIFOXYB1_FULL_41_27]OGK70653.1 MAG: hypothetical protein A2313_02730 [Candidatus Roizmanbacteria bacterium RIFOXYB2_FULL_41_10]OGK70885.1 MAG: hypothetical protein A2403_02280 [Candidatus Roizmanbacteria bacterium RIFOXYC1_FULL_41_16]OGK75139.1 MAG: hypothetical protein A2459_01995 [Candidatus Roizmanbacteria ba